MREGDVVANRYRIGRHAGAGGMGTVYEAIDSRDGGRVAVGLLPRALARPLARLERHGLLILIGLLFLLPWLSRSLGYDVNILAWVIWRPVVALFGLVTRLTGLA